MSAPKAKQLNSNREAFQLVGSYKAINRSPEAFGFVPRDVAFVASVTCSVMLF